MGVEVIVVMSCNVCPHHTSRYCWQENDDSSKPTHLGIARIQGPTTLKNIR